MAELTTSLAGGMPANLTWGGRVQSGAQGKGRSLPEGFGHMKKRVSQAEKTTSVEGGKPQPCPRDSDSVAQHGCIIRS